MINKKNAIIILSLTVSILVFYSYGKLYYSGGKYKFINPSGTSDLVIELKDGNYYENGNKFGTYTTFFNNLTVTPDRLTSKGKLYGRASKEEIEIFVEGKFWLPPDYELKYKRIK